MIQIKSPSTCVSIRWRRRTGSRTSDYCRARKAPGRLVPAIRWPDGRMSIETDVITHIDCIIAVNWSVNLLSDLPRFLSKVVEQLRDGAAEPWAKVGWVQDVWMSERPLLEHEQ